MRSSITDPVRIYEKKILRQILEPDGEKERLIYWDHLAQCAGKQGVPPFAEAGRCGHGMEFLCRK